MGWEKECERNMKIERVGEGANGCTQGREEKRGFRLTVQLKEKGE